MRKGCDLLKYWNVLLTGVLTALNYLYGKIDTPLIALTVFIVIDTILGIFGAIVNKQLNSEKLRTGAIHKAVCGLVIVFSVVLDRLCGTMWIIRNLTLHYYIIHEGISILENLYKCGVPYPKQLKNIFEQLKKDDEKNG